MGGRSLPKKELIELMSILGRQITSFLDMFRVRVDHLPNGGDFSLPNKLWSFVWFFLKQIKPLLFLIALTSAIEAISISYTYWFIGEISKIKVFDASFMLLGICIVAITPISSNFLIFLKNALYVPYFGNMIRRQCFHYVSGQSISYFQNDFSGRIANKLLQCSSALRDATLSVLGFMVSVCMLIITNATLLSKISIILALPIIIWTFLFISILLYFLPRIKQRTVIAAECMSTLTGQIVDTFSNILIAKYFSRTAHENSRALSFLEAYGNSMSDALLKSTQQSICLGIINIILVVSTMYIGYGIVAVNGTGDISVLVMALPMVIQTTFLSNRIMNEMSSIFENIGTVQNSVDILSKPLNVIDKPNAIDFIIPTGQADIIFNNVTFQYSQTADTVLNLFNLQIKAGEKIGLIGRSGEGKSTIISLLVRAFDVERGTIMIAGQNIADVTQDSLRRNISIVTQDNYLFHRSVLDNIRYGRPDATLEDVINAAKSAQAHDFIEKLVDHDGRRGYEAYVGERGVNLSGGQRQRIDIARAILKDAPILIFDEATSSMDSESEEVIQTALQSVMAGKTVIAVAHRLSTLRKMDRIVVLDQGRVVEEGSHDDLIQKADGHYARLWMLQTEGYRD